MKSEENYFKIGLFVLGATALLVTGTIMLGAGHLFRKQIVLESYFDESVQGLEKGSPVKFQGLTIGEVSSIDTVSYLYDKQLSESQRLSNARYVAVTMSITSYEAVGLEAATHEDEILQAVARGLRFRLASIGLTGTKFVEASFFDPERVPPFEFEWTPRHPYVPSAPDAINNIIDNVEDLMDRLAGSDLEGILQNLDDTIETTRQAIAGLNTPDLSVEVLALATELRTTTQRINQLLGDPALDSAPGDAAAVLASARTISSDLERRLPAILERFDAASESLQSGLARLDGFLGDPGTDVAVGDLHAVAANMRTASEELPDTVVQLRATLRDVQRMFGGNDQSVEEIFANLRMVSANLRSITDELRANPARVLFGDPPPPGPSER